MYKNVYTYIITSRKESDDNHLSQEVSLDCLANSTEAAYNID